MVSREPSAFEQPDEACSPQPKRKETKSAYSQGQAETLHFFAGSSLVMLTTLRNLHWGAYKGGSRRRRCV